MKNLIENSLGLVLSLTTITLLAASANVSAEIYKWRDATGRMQYSDKPPVEGFTNASREEVVNALQSKERCEVPGAKTNTANATTGNATTGNIQSNFAGFGFNNKANTPAAGFGGIGSLGNVRAAGKSTSGIAATKAAAARVAAARTGTRPAPVAAKPLNYSPFGGGKAATFNIGKQSVTAFNIPARKPVAAAPATSPAPAPVDPAANNVLPKAGTTNPAPVQANATIAPTAAAPAPTANNTPAPKAETGAVPPLAKTPDGPLASNIIKVALMPAVDISKNITAALGYSDLRIVASSLAKDQPPVGDGIGEFRIDCGVSHMSNDDPIVYPNQQGAAHHHTFFGNTSINYKTNVNTVATTGNSTCRGGIANRSAYWIPSMIDTASNTAIKPTAALWYYKTGFVAKETITAPPKGLRMIAGKMKSTSPQATRFPEFTCQMPAGKSPPASKNIPACPQGATIVSHVSFPQCWDGVNLDSPDHISHMAERVGGKCPATHPVAIPWIALNTKYKVTDASGTANWRLSSDNYKKDGYNSGYSSHADWINGWDEKVMKGIVKNCLQRGVDCGNHMLGDGTIIF